MSSVEETTASAFQGRRESQSTSFNGARYLVLVLPLTLAIPLVDKRSLLLSSGPTLDQQSDSSGYEAKSMTCLM